MKNVATVDIETEAIPDLVSNIKTIHCIAVKWNGEATKCFTSKKVPYSDGTLNEALELMNKADLIVGHNFYKFDKPVIENILGKITPPIIDTLIDAKLAYPKDLLMAWDYQRDDIPSSLKGSYSLKAFGYRLNLNKIEYEDFSELCEDMVTYCKRDVDLTYSLYLNLISRAEYPSQAVRELEYKVAQIIYQQQEYGFYFDIDSAMTLATNLKFKQMNLEHKLNKVFKPIFVADGDMVNPKKARRSKEYIKTPLDCFRNIRPKGSNGLSISKKGTLKLPPKSLKLLDFPHKIVYTTYDPLGQYQKIKLERFNPNSRQQIAKRLIKHFNWIPTAYTEKGNIKLDEKILKQDMSLDELKEELNDEIT